MKNAFNRKIVPQAAAKRGVGGQLRTWTRRLHFYLGLYFLLFLWLFSISGLFLNHPEWELTHDFWEQRQESSSERVIVPPHATGDLAIAKDLMRQLGIAGEVNEIKRSSADDQFSFRTERPGQIFNVDARLDTRRAIVKQVDLNVWGVLNGLHKFTGVSMNEPGRERDWALTMIWSIAMDAVALGLMVLVLSGVYLWYRLKKKRLSGWWCWGRAPLLAGFSFWDSLTCSEAIFHGSGIQRLCGFAQSLKTSASGFVRGCNTPAPGAWPGRPASRRRGRGTWRSLHARRGGG